MWNAKLSEILEHLRAIYEVHGDLPVFSTDSRSGIIERLDATPNVQRVTGREVGGGDILDMEEGEEYVNFTVGL